MYNKVHFAFFLHFYRLILPRIQVEQGRLYVHTRFLSVVGLPYGSKGTDPHRQGPDKKPAQVECVATDVRLTYDCIITLTNKTTGHAFKELNLRFHPDMPSMPVRMKLKPVAVREKGMGMYHFHLVLEMYGEWA
ncbi:MAG: hypothetical protein CM1200mP18_23560 [Gammaproteobacteria bacterium]|nr:MAG: hypothetical protein CM1200mP18_23560 [Gammaproteobacteria bacterium]